MINKIISHYKVIDKLGEGGMGVLYLAEDLELNRKAVLKFLPPDMMNDPDTNLRFKREAQSAGSLSHPNIVTIYDVGVYENKTFIAMEYVEGKTLREFLKSDELIIERITDISVQICEGLNAAHSKGITHRDIKPENILIDENGKVKIVDFGLAKVKNVSRGITRQDSTVGTLKYMSPEQIRNQNVDHRSDIWSFGVILYEMITGKYPFKGEHDASLFYSIINQSPEPLARYKSNISKGFQRVIDKSLDKDPETRYQHIDELLSDLRREKRDSGEFALSKSKGKNTRLIKRISLISAALIAIALIFIAVNYFLNNRVKNVNPPKHTQLTFEGNIYNYQFDIPKFLDIAQISPDGQFTAYVAGEGNEKSIYVKDNYGGRVFEIFKSLKDVFDLRWAANGNEIFFTASSGSASEMDELYSSYIISKFGDKVQELNLIQYGCWSPDGILIAGIFSSDKKITLIKPETGEFIRTLELEGSYRWIVDIDWSPKNDKILFLTLDSNYVNYTIWTIDADGSKQKKILAEAKNLYSPRWSYDGNYIYYLQSNELTKDLIKIEVSSGVSNQVSSVVQTGLQAFGFSITRDNKKLCYTKTAILSNLWKFSYDEGKNLYSTKKLTEGTAFFSDPSISPDGKQIALSHKNNIYKMSINGDSLRQLTFLNSECYRPRWSPNGEEIAFIANTNLAKVSSKEGALTIFKKTAVGYDISWGPNLEIFYHIADNRNFYIFNPITEEKKLLVSNDSLGWMFSPSLSPDNKNIAVYWNRLEEVGLWIISLKNSSQKLLIKGIINPLKWSQDNRWIYAINSEKLPMDILMISSSNGLTKIVYTLPSNQINRNSSVDISPDGKTIVAAIQETNSDVWMIENFDPDVE